MAERAKLALISACRMHRSPEALKKSPNAADSRVDGTNRRLIHSFENVDSAVSLLYKRTIDSVVIFNLRVVVTALTSLGGFAARLVIAIDVAIATPIHRWRL
jgi:hypothetical protein